MQKRTKHFPLQKKIRNFKRLLITFQICIKWNNQAVATTNIQRNKNIIRWQAMENTRRPENKQVKRTDLTTHKNKIKNNNEHNVMNNKM